MMKIGGRSPSEPRYFAHFFFFWKITWYVLGEVP